ncbi:hypothetical protein V6N13_109438 [Hibiscus sabdariffa]
MAKVSLASPSFYVFSFPNATVRDWVLEQSPWHIHHKPLILRKWEPNLPQLDSKLDRMPVWLQLYNVPLELFNKTELEANAIVPSNVTVLMPDRSYVVIHVVVTWTPPSFTKCKKYGHWVKHCTDNEPKLVQVWQKKSSSDFDDSLNSKDIIVSSKHIGVKHFVEKEASSTIINTTVIPTGTDVLEPTVTITTETNTIKHVESPSVNVIVDTHIGSIFVEDSNGQIEDTLSEANVSVHVAQKAKKARESAKSKKRHRSDFHSPMPLKKMRYAGPRQPTIQQPSRSSFTPKPQECGSFFLEDHFGS